MTSRQLTIVDALKAGSEEFTTMRQLAMRFRGLFRGGSWKSWTNGYVTRFLAASTACDVLRRHCGKTKAQCRTP